jgi:hypothetical protein
MEAAIEAGAEDVESDLEQPDIYEPAPGHRDLHGAGGPAGGGRRADAQARGAEVDGGRVATEIADPGGGRCGGTLVKLVEALEDEDDVQRVYFNADLDDAEIERLAG